MTNLEIADNLLKFVAKYDAENPWRTADMHQHECPCQRCLIDFVRAAASRLANTEPKP